MNTAASFVMLVWLVSMVPHPTSITPTSRDTPHEIIRRAIQAQGGRQSLEKTLNHRCRGKGTIAAGSLKGSVTIDYWYQFPDRTKIVGEIKVGNLIINDVRILNGKEGWNQKNGDTKAFTNGELAAARAGAYHTYIRHLIPLLEESKFTLTLLDEVTVNGRLASGIKVLSTGYKEIRLYFDKETSLLVKSEYLGHTGELKEVLTEEYFTDYKEINRVKLPFKKTIYLDGKQYLDVEIAEWQFYDKIDGNEFVKP